MLGNIARVQPLRGCLSRLRHDNHNQFYWTELDNKERQKALRVRSKHFKDPVVQKQEFQNTLRQCLDEVKSGELEILPRRDSMMPVKVTHRLLQLFLHGSDKFQKEPLSSESAELLADEKLLLRFAKQLAFFYEHPGRFEMPSCGFESYTTEEMFKFMKSPVSIVFAMRKQAQRNNRYRKKESVLKPEMGELCTGSRGDLTPNYQLKKCYDKMTFWRIARSPVEENPFIFDMNFDDYMSTRCFHDLVKQIELAMKFNMQQRDPMHFMFANMKKDSYSYRSLSSRNVHGFPNKFYTVSDSNLLQLDGIKKENLIYLTPDAVETLDVFDETKVYIMGGLVDNANAQKAIGTTYNLAQSIGIPRVKFPLKTYLEWGNVVGRDELSLDVAYKVFHTFRATRNWARAFSHIPKRFHRGLTEFGRTEVKGNAELLDWYDGIISRTVTPGRSKNKNSMDFLEWS